MEALDILALKLCYVLVTYLESGCCYHVMVGVGVERERVLKSL